jgi:uncharacterized protein YbaP (TraB family)
MSSHHYSLPARACPSRFRPALPIVAGLALALSALLASPSLAVGAEPLAAAGGDSSAGSALSAAPAPPSAEPAQAAASVPPSVTSADASQPPADEAPDPDAIPEVSVVGERPGPGLWRVVNGDRTLYILGTLRPLPKKMVWKSREVEEVVARSQLVIPERPDIDADLGPIKAVRLYFQWRNVRRNAEGAALEDVLPPDLYQRFQALRATYAPDKRDMLKRRPVLAAGELWNEALNRSGLSLRIGIDRRIRSLAKQGRVPVAEPTLRVEDPQSLLAEAAQIPLEAEVACMRATLDRLESDLANARTLAEAWATGDVELIRSKAEWQHEQACWESLTSAPKLAELRRRFDEVWFEEAVRALETKDVALAVAPMPTLLKPGGVLEQLAARGYDVIAP